MSQKINLEQITTLMSNTKDILKDSIDRSESGSYFFGMFFFKFLCDNFEDISEVIAKDRVDAEKLSPCLIVIPECSRWSNLQDLKHDIGAELNKASEAIEKHNQILEGVLTSIDFNLKSKLSDKKLQELLFLFSKYRLDDENLDDDVMTTLFFNIGDLVGIDFTEGKYPDEHSTPNELSRLLVALLEPTPGMTIYDPAAGLGGILLEAANYLVKKHDDELSNLAFYGQEINTRTWALSKMVMLVHFIDADMRNGCTLKDPQHTRDGALMTFDRVISNPPFNMRWRHDYETDPDSYGRYPYGIPSKISGDMAFIQHMIKSLNPKGKMAIIVPFNALSASQDTKIRKGIIEEDLIEAIIELPSSLFFNTSIRTYILIINKSKSKERKDKILYIGAEKEYEEAKFKNKLRDPDIKKIVSIYENWQVEESFSEYITLNQIKEDDFNVHATISEIKFNHITSSIDTDFKKYKPYKLSDVSIDIQRCKALSSDLESSGSDNDIFIPVGKSKVVSKREETKLKDHNLLRVSLDEKIVRSDYLAIFFNSTYGKEILEMMAAGSTIRSLGLSRIKDIVVNIPSLLEQEKIVSVGKSLNTIRIKINDIEGRLLLKPADNEQLKVIDSILSSLNNLDTRTHLSSEPSPLLCEESMIHEFKAALRVPYPSYPEPSVDEKGQQQFKLKEYVFKSKKEIHNHLEFIIMKTIASFLNTAGGTLVIGVHEYANKKNVVGIDREEFESSDHYVRHLIQVLNNAFNAVIVSRFINVAIEEINGIEVCVVRCPKDTGGEVFYLKDSVYVRTGPRIDQLTTKEVVDLYKEKTRSSHDNTS